MPDLWGREYNRAELLRRIGRLEQLAGVRLITLADRVGVLSGPSEIEEFAARVESSLEGGRR